MKQTNNAIKFLVAQYRAIFKNAYLKGITTAGLLAVGLAAGAAQANPVTSLTGTEVVIDGTNNTALNLSDTVDVPDTLQTITIKSGAASDTAGNYLKSDQAAATLTAPKVDLVIDGREANGAAAKNAVGLKILAGATADSGATAQFKSVKVINGVLDVDGGTAGVAKLIVSGTNTIEVGEETA